MVQKCMLHGLEVDVRMRAYMYVFCTLVRLLVFICACKSVCMYVCLPVDVCMYQSLSLNVCLFVRL